MYSLKKVAAISLLLTCALLLSVQQAHAQSITTFNVGPPRTNFPFEGFGVELDPFFFNNNNQNYGATQEDWDSIIVPRLKQMQLPIVRMMFQMYWANGAPVSGQPPENWNWDFSNHQMLSLFKYLDFTKENNITVNLVEWGWVPVWDNRAGWPPVTHDDPRVAQAIAYIVDYLINTRGYTNIKYLTVMNEPDNESQGVYMLQNPELYYRMYRNVHQELTNRGIRDQIILTGVDMGGTWDWFKNGITNLHDILDAYDYHRYATFNEVQNVNLEGDWDTLWSHLYLWRGEVNSRDPQGSSKPLMLTEMGNAGGSTFTHPLIDTTNYAIHMADYGVTLLNTDHITGIAWEAFDIYYFASSPGAYMNWGMWTFADQGWSLRPWAQTWALLTKFAVPSSHPMPVNGTPPANPDISQQRLAAITRPDGGLTLFLINRESFDRSFQINLPHAPEHSFTQYLWDPQTFTNYPDQLIISPSATVPASQNLSVNVPAESFIVLVEGPSSQPDPIPNPACEADVNANGTVEIGDISGILFYWGQSCSQNPSSCIADVNANGNIEVGDIAGVLFYWGGACQR